MSYLRDMTCTLSFSRAAARSVIRLFSFAKASFKSATRVRSLFSEFLRSFCTCSACWPLTNTKSHQERENCEFSCSLQYCTKLLLKNFTMMHSGFIALQQKPDIFHERIFQKKIWEILLPFSHLLRRSQVFLKNFPTRFLNSVIFVSGRFLSFFTSLKIKQTSNFAPSEYHRLN